MNKELENLLEELAEAKSDVREGKVAPIEDTFNKIRQELATIIEDEVDIELHKKRLASKARKQEDSKDLDYVIKELNL